VTKTITKIGNSQGIVFDAAFMDLARLKVGDRVDATIVPDSGAIILMPLRNNAPARDEISATIKKTMKDYRRTLKRLA
jgi:antitoxin component of MazEF toxin-antitoxin module